MQKESEAKTETNFIFLVITNKTPFKKKISVFFYVDTEKQHPPLQLRHKGPKSKLDEQETIK